MSLGLSKFSNEPSLHARSLPIKKRGVSISHSCSSVRINAVPKLSCMPETHKRNKSYVDPEEGLGVRTTPLENHKTIGFLNNTGLDFMENHKATKPAFNVGLSAARQRTPFKWRFAGVPMMPALSVILEPLSSSLHCN